MNQLDARDSNNMFEIFFYYLLKAAEDAQTVLGPGDYSDRVLDCISMSEMFVMQGILNAMK